MALQGYEVLEDKTIEIANEDLVPVKKTSGEKKKLVFASFEKVWNWVAKAFAGAATSETKNDVKDAINTRINAQTISELNTSTTAPVNSTAVTAGLGTKQDTLVSGTNIKTIHSKSIVGDGDLTLSAADVGAVPSARTVNSKALSDNIVLSASDVGALADSVTHLSGDVPTDREINGYPLNANVTLDYSDVGALPDTTTHLSGDVPVTRKINNKALDEDISLDYSDVGALASDGKAVSATVADNVIAGGVAGQVLTSNGSDAPTWRNLPDVTGFDYKIVTKLPTTGEKGILYLIEIPVEEKSDDEQGNSYKEYIWIGNKYELLGIISGSVAGIIPLTRAEYDALEGNYKKDAIYIITDEDDYAFAIDQEFKANSTNAQSGKAVKQAIDSIGKITTVDTVESGNMNPVTSNAVNGALTGYTPIIKIPVGDGSHSYVPIQDVPDGVYIITISALYTGWNIFYVGILSVFGNEVRLDNIVYNNIIVEVTRTQINTSCVLSSAKLIPIGYW